MDVPIGCRLAHCHCLDNHRDGSGLHRCQAALTQQGGGLVIDAARLQRAVWLEVQAVAPGWYLVRGGKDDHVVDVDGGYIRCECLDARWRGDNCKHCLAVRLRHGDPEVVEALRTLVPSPHRSRAIGRRS